MTVDSFVCGIALLRLCGGSGRVLSSPTKILFLRVILIMKTEKTIASSYLVIVDVALGYTRAEWPTTYTA
jgi:hypothetical protein